MKKSVLRKSIERIINRIVRIEGIEKILDMYNLKLYDLACYDNCTIEDFELFTDIEYENFGEYLKENSCKLHYYANTSSFFILNDNSKINEYILMRGSNISFTEKIETLVDAFLYEYIDYNLEIENLILTIEGDIIKSAFDIPFLKDEEEEEDYNNYFDTLDKDLIEFIEYNIANVNNIIKYIEDFKKNQITYFKEFKENN